MYLMIFVCRKLELDLVPRNSEGEVINPDTTSIHHLYNVVWTSCTDIVWMKNIKLVGFCSILKAKGKLPLLGYLLLLTLLVCFIA